MTAIVFIFGGIAAATFWLYRQLCRCTFPLTIMVMFELCLKTSI